ncbi:hypothetical protein DFH27DRAFT_613288 [Peziza echinospora]|nr:hypothetical protein DFH27DRAFT_613288 [Peziza echinospora]
MRMLTTHTRKFDPACEAFRRTPAGLVITEAIITLTEAEADALHSLDAAQPRPTPSHLTRARAVLGMVGLRLYIPALATESTGTLDFSVGITAALRIPPARPAWLRRTSHSCLLYTFLSIDGMGIVRRSRQYELREECDACEIVGVIVGILEKGMAQLKVQ